MTASPRPRIQAGSLALIALALAVGCTDDRGDVGPGPNAGAPGQRGAGDTTSFGGPSGPAGVETVPSGTQGPDSGRAGTDRGVVGPATTDQDAPSGIPR